MVDEVKLADLFGEAEGHIGFDIKTTDGCGIVAYNEKGESEPYNICSVRVHHSTDNDVSVSFFESLGREGSPGVVINIKPEELMRIWFAADTLARLTLPTPETPPLEPAKEN